jgi:hypothetical protein
MSAATRYSHDEYLSALHAIPPGLKRDEGWLKVVTGAKAAGLTAEQVEQWSAQADNYESAGFRDTWRSFKEKGGTGPGSLIYLARDHGWKPDGKRPMLPAITSARVDFNLPEKPPRTYAPGKSPEDVWSRCNPATAAHPYIVAKQAQGAPLDGLRVVPAGDPLRINGESMAGALAVPAYNAEGEMQSLQLILPPEVAARLKAKDKQGKMNLAGAPMAGGFHVVGNLEPGGVAYVVEGIGQAWACWRATGRAAVVSFGVGNIKTVAGILKQRDPSARLVLVPDAGKEEKIREAALELGCMFVLMPDGSPDNFDVSDLAQRDGIEALTDWLDMEVRKVEPPPAPVHPLARFVTLRKTPQAVKWVVPGVIEQGVVTIAGARGVGKTTSILPLALSAAGLHESGYPLAPHPDRWRHVIYAVEQVEQAERILAGLVECSGIGITWEQVEERFHLVEAVRLNVEDVLQVAGTYREQFAREVNGVEILPLVVFDTQAASFEMDNENDNAEASRIMAALKQRFEHLPIWIVGHVAKDAIGREEVKGLTARGAGAFEADSIANLYLTTDKQEQRFLSIGKRRAEPRFGADLLIDSGHQVVTGFNEWGEPEDVHLRWGIVRPMEQSRAELAAAGRAAADALLEQQEREEIRGRLFTTARDAWEKGDPLSPSALRERVTGGSKAKRDQYLADLMNEGRLIERHIPKNLVKHNRKAYILPLEPDEYLTYTQTGELPPRKANHPLTWAKAPDEAGDTRQKKEGEEEPKN